MAPNPEVFKPKKATENKFKQQLADISKKIHDAAMQVHSPEDLAKFISKLHGYKSTLKPFADKTANRIIEDVRRINDRSWKSYSAISKKHSQELRKALKNPRFAKTIKGLKKEASMLITSLPDTASKKAVEYANDYAIRGMRAEDLIDKVQKLGSVTKNRAKLIARTEIARATTIMTQSRAVSIGSNSYIWHSSTDGRVRDSHAEMNGEEVFWANPPTLDGLTGHAGEFPNCRCWPEPVIPEEPAFEEGLAEEGYQEAEKGMDPVIGGLEPIDNAEDITEVPGNPKREQEEVIPILEPEPDYQGQAQQIAEEYLSTIVMPKEEVVVEEAAVEPVPVPAEPVPVPAEPKPNKFIIIEEEGKPEIFKTKKPEPEKPKPNKFALEEDIRKIENNEKQINIINEKMDAIKKETNSINDSLVANPGNIELKKRKDELWEEEIKLKDEKYPLHDENDFLKEIVYSEPKEGATQEDFEKLKQLKIAEGELKKEQSKIKEASPEKALWKALGEDPGNKELEASAIKAAKDSSEAVMKLKDEFVAKYGTSFHEMKKDLFPPKKWVDPNPFIPMPKDFSAKSKDPLPNVTPHPNFDPGTSVDFVKAHGSKYGTVINRDSTVIEDQRVNIRAVEFEGKKGYSYTFNVTPENMPSVGEALKAGGAKTTHFSFDERKLIDDESNISKVKPHTKEIFGQDNYHLLEKENVKITFVDNGTKTDVRALRGRVEIVVTGTEEEIKAALPKALNQMGLDNSIFHEPTEEDRKILKYNAYIQKNFPNNSDVWNLTPEDKADPAKLEQIIIKRGGLDHLDKIQNIKTREIVPGYSAEIQEGASEEYKKEGVKHLFHGWGGKPDALVDSIINDEGLSSTMRRFDNGVMINGASSRTDLGSGGAQSVFLRVANSEAKMNYKDSYMGNLPKLIFDAKEMDRMDWYGYGEDSYGVKDGDTYMNRKGAVDFVKETKKGRPNNEIMFQNGVSFDNLTAIHCQTPKQRTDIIDGFKRKGVTMVKGIPVEDFVQIVKKY